MSKSKKEEKTSFQTKISKIKMHLLKHKSITTWQAIEVFQVTRLAAVIFALKKTHGMTNIISQRVEGKNKHGQVMRFAKYIYTK